MSWLREPLVHFLGLGAVVLGVQIATETAEYPEIPRTIVVSTAIQEDLAREYQTTHGRPPRQDELREVTQQWVRTEMLVREARLLGLDQTDPQVRTRLAQKMSTMTQATEVPPEPSDTELRELYEELSPRFAMPARLTVRQLAATDEAQAIDLADQWSSGADPRELTQATAPGGPVLRGRTADNLRQHFGNEFAEQAQQLPLEQPSVVSTPSGWRVIAVQERTEASVVPFEQAEARLRVQWKQRWLADQGDVVVERLRQSYTVVGAD